MDKQKPIIFLSGGGTLGSVTPLLALAEDLGEEALCHFVGSNNGVERSLLADSGLLYHGIASGKLRRYFSLHNFIDPLFISYGFCQSLWLICKYRPSLIVSAGSFVSVPLVCAARLLGIKAVSLQLDVLPGLANRLMSWLGATMALVLPELKATYPQGVLTGCPIRQALRLAATLDQSAARASFDLRPDLPTILVLAGGTGSLAINKLVLDNLYNLTQVCQVIHITGPSKRLSADKNQYYRSVELSDDAQMATAIVAADLVVSRAGMGAITELAYLSKPVILIPLPQSHQEANAKYFVERGAATRLDQNKTTAWNFVSYLKSVLADTKLLSKQAKCLNATLPTEANRKFRDFIIKQLS